MCCISPTANTENFRATRPKTDSKPWSRSRASCTTCAASPPTTRASSTFPSRTTRATGATWSRSATTPPKTSFLSPPSTTDMMSAHQGWRGMACACFAACLVCACESELRPTPGPVADRYHALVDSLDDDQPGASAATLTEFLGEAGPYQIADSVRIQIRHFELLSYGLYHEARALARVLHG